MSGFEAQIPRNGHSIAKIYNEKGALFSPKVAVHGFCRGSLSDTVGIVPINAMID